MTKSHLKLVAPATLNRTVPPRRPPNGKLRTREYLTEAEVESLLAAVRRHRYGHRDATMILVAYRHGLRLSELVDLRRDQIDFAAANLHVRRVKQGTPSTHPVLGDELRALRRLQREEAVAKGAPPIWERLASIGTNVPADTWDAVPTDLSANIDHYLYGGPKDKH